MDTISKTVTVFAVIIPIATMLNIVLGFILCVVAFYVLRSIYRKIEPKVEQFITDVCEEADRKMSKGELKK